VLDEGGADGLSIRAVASRLGLHPNAVYTYVADRAALERLVAERVLSRVEPTILAGPPEGWRSRILDYADALRSELLRHPPVVFLLMRAPMDGPHARRIGEHLMAALAAGGLEPDAAVRGSYALITYVLGSVALEVAETDGRPPLPPEHERVAARRSALSGVDAAEWPRTAASVDVIADWISTGQFRWGLERILDGIARSKAVGASASKSTLGSEA
jgi:TetR/AcrR family tetracycline transcriptional repressor